MEKPWNVVVVSSNLENRQDVAGMLFRLGVDPISVSTLQQCHELAARENIGLVFCDKEVKGGDYRDVLSAMKLGPSAKIPRVVLMSPSASTEEYKTARQYGLFDVISSPCRQTDVEWMIIQAKRDSRKEARNLLESARAASALWRTARAGA